MQDIILKPCPHKLMRKVVGFRELTELTMRFNHVGQYVIVVFRALQTLVDQQLFPIFDAFGPLTKTGLDVTQNRKNAALELEMLLVEESRD